MNNSGPWVFIGDLNALSSFEDSIALMVRMVKIRPMVDYINVCNLKNCESFSSQKIKNSNSI